MKQKTERKNDGFTLVEILIAITILGIIIVPFMHSFVTASRTNAKSKTLQNATTLAANLMEEIKANSIEDLAFQFNYPTRADGTSRFDIIDKNSFSSAAELTCDGTSYEKVDLYLKNAAGVGNRDRVTASVIYESYDVGTSDEYEYLGQSQGKYYFLMKAAKSGTGTYDALITMDANPYKTATDTGYNDQNSPVIDSVDVRKDALYVQKKDWDLDFAKKIIKNSGQDGKILPDTLLDDDLSNGELKRTIEIDIEKTSSITKVYITYRYETYNYSIGSYSVESDPILVYSNAESPGYELRNIYLFYMPNYASCSIGSRVVDQIVINNFENLEADVYLVKQKQSSLNSYMYEMKETTYYCKVFMNEDVGVFNASTHEGYLSLKSNLGENIYDETETLIYPFGLYYGNKEGSQQASGDSAKRILNVNVLDGADVKDRIYDVKVEVYEEGQADGGFTKSPIATITGSKDN